MALDPSKRLTLNELLTTVNTRYDENYLSEYFDPNTGRAKAGSGDSLAKFIVCELRETFEEDSTRQQQLALAVRTLERAGANRLQPHAPARSGRGPIPRPQAER